jgi:hypothetical protein
VQQVKERSLQTQLDNLIADADAVNQQLGYSTNGVERIRLERQLAAIAQEMDNVAAALDALGA